MVTGHGTARDQISALAGKHCTNDQSDHTDDDQGYAPDTAIHVSQFTVNRFVAPIPLRSGYPSDTRQIERDISNAKSRETFCLP
jgi:hypothetical protein